MEKLKQIEYSGRVINPNMNENFPKLLNLKIRYLNIEENRIMEELYT